MSGRFEIGYEVLWTQLMSWCGSTNKMTDFESYSLSLSWFFFFVFLSFSFFIFTAKAISLPSHVHYTWISKAVLSNMVLILCGRQSVLHCRCINGPQIWLESYHAWLLYPGFCREHLRMRIKFFIYAKRNTRVGASLSIEKHELWHLETVKCSQSTAIMFGKCTSLKIVHEFIRSYAFLAILTNCYFPLTYSSVLCRGRLKFILLRWMTASCSGHSCEGSLQIWLIWYSQHIIN